MLIEINKLLEMVYQYKASDLHISVGRPPTVRLNGKLRSLGKVNLTSEDTISLMKQITPESKQAELQQMGGCDFGCAFSDVARFRVSVFRQKGACSIVLRMIPNKLYTFEELGLPEVVLEWLNKEKGLFLVTGPTGSGKSTTLATMIDYINVNFSKHIVTVEDPIEFYHTHKKCVVNQREIGVDVPSFSEALRRVLRQDPDVILVGEMRDLETISAAITAAETGHLVFGTLHTTGAAQTMARIIDAYPTSQQEQVRAQLATTLLAVISQTLVPLKTGEGRVAAYELMFCVPAVRHLIRENQTFKIDSIIQTSAKLGMSLLDDSLYALFAQGQISLEEALQRAPNPDVITEKLRERREHQGLR